MYQLFIFLQIMLIAVSLVLTGMVLRKQPAAAQRLILIAVLSVFLQCCAYYIELTAVSMDVVLAAVKLEYVSICTLTLSYLQFVFSYCRIKMPKALCAFEIVFNISVVLLVATIERHDFFYRNISFTDNYGFWHLEFDQTPIYLINMCNQIILAVLCIVMMTRQVRKNLHRVRLYGFVAVLVFPIILGILYMTVGLNGYYPGSFCYLLTIAAIIIAAYKYNFFRVVQTVKESMLDNMEEAFIITDDRYLYLDSNESAREIFPKLENCLENDSVGSILFGDEKSLGVENEGEYEINGNTYTCHIQQIVEGKLLKGYAIVFTDVTAERRHDRDMLDMTRRAEAANKAKSQFLANMSHEIRTPMNAIIGMGEIVLRGNLDGTQRLNMERIMHSSNSLLQLINNILDLSKIEEGRIEIENQKYQLEKLLCEVCNICTVKISERPIEFRIITEPSLPVGLYGDMQKVKEILMNLLGNAIKYCKEGSITLKITGKYVNDDRSEEGFLPFMLDMEVADTGIGIKKENLEIIFEAYTQTDTVKNKGIVGTGLGLAITKSYVEAMGGTISVESDYGRGSVFKACIEQKVYDQTELGKQEIRMELLQEETDSGWEIFHADVTFPGAKVLVVDDIGVNLRVSEGLLEPYEVEVDCARSGAEAVEMIKSGHYDLVLMDHMMPEMDGVTATKLIRELGMKFNELPVIALTANALSGMEDFFIENGMNGFLPKPIDLKELDLTLRKWLSSKCVHKRIAEEDSEKMLEESFSMLREAGITPEEGLKYTGDISMYRWMLGQFYDNFTNYDVNLEELAKENAGRFSVLVHGIKSSIATIGADGLFEEAQQLETAGKNGDITIIEERLKPFLKHFHKLLDVLEQWKENSDGSND